MKFKIGATDNSTTDKLYFEGLSSLEVPPSPHGFATEKAALYCRK